jgi:hypothetical protein
MTPDERMDAYRAAHKEAKGVNPSVSYSHGWYLVGEYPGTAKWRGWQLEAATRMLRHRAGKSA